MSSQQYPSTPHPSLQYTLHPLISQLNMDLLRQSPHNALQYIKLWATKRINAIYSIGTNDGDQQQQSQQQHQQQQQLYRQSSHLHLPKRLLPVFHNGTLLPLITNRTIIIADNNNTITSNKQFIKRRHAVMFSYSQIQNNEVNNEDQIEIQKNEQTNSRVLISLKNDPFFRNLSWQQIHYFAFIGRVFQTRHQNQLLQCAYQPIQRFFIIVSGEVYTTVSNSQPQQQIKTYYTGQSFCHQSFLYTTNSRHSYYARQTNTVLFTLCGGEVKQTIQKYARERQLFYQKVLMNKEEFNYLDLEERDKVIRCFKERKEIMQGEVVFRGEVEAVVKQNRFYVVVKGKFSKCKKNSNGQLIAFKHLREGDYFGQQNLLSLTSVDYTVMCLQDNSELAYFDKNSLELAVDDYSRIIQRGKMQVKYIAGQGR